MEQLCSEFPGRRDQIELLSDFFLQNPFCRTPELFFVYGGHAGGKTSLVTKFLTLCEDRVSFAVVTCVECYTTKLLLESIVSQLFNDSASRTCANVAMLIDYLRLLYKQIGEQKHIIIVLDNCEYLDELGEEFMRSLSRLRELSKIPTLSVVLISHLLPDKFNANFSAAVPVYFPQYNRDELLQILMKNKPDSCTDDQFYMNYLKAALSIFYNVTRDLSEITQMVNSNFVKYCEPLEKSACSKENSMALWRNVVPFLKASMLSAFSGTSICEKKCNKPQNESLNVDLKNIASLDLPYFSKYFLIASYLASYNSTKYDKRLFLKNRGKRRKRKDYKKSKDDAASIHLLGPRVFPLDRLLAIFYFIIDDNPNLTASLLSQISTLVELRLLIKLADGVLDKPSYKCMASYSCVDSVARTVGFNISKYLMA